MQNRTLPTAALAHPLPAHPPIPTGQIMVPLSDSLSSFNCRRDVDAYKGTTTNDEDFMKAACSQIHVMESSCPRARLGADISHGGVGECDDNGITVGPWHRCDFDLTTGASETGLRACTYTMYQDTEDPSSLVESFRTTSISLMVWTLISSINLLLIRCDLKKLSFKLSPASLEICSSSLSVLKQGHINPIDHSLSTIRALTLQFCVPDVDTGTAVTSKTRSCSSFFTLSSGGWFDD
ncbi:hypothetical protein JAAARDRAFT_262851 [Jaapia argillacea MUCL 33604]|uniref:Uncharacterized protein n=1 Tax=Jaapia argillacea MUCL 33604 TaxID=933084 RepID=A0A067P5I2_9AGAM|nr:hypothetical protein JAAARDRAFT_262851 [Jaapia argillacea MUCL 33604]